MKTLATLALIGATVTLGAQTPGTYRLAGGSYSIKVQTSGADLVVTEPNKTSRYKKYRDGVYRFYNQNTRAWYYLDVVDAQTLRTRREPATAGPPSILKLVGGSAAAQTKAVNANYAALAERYKLLAEGDADNVQAWTFCAAAANAYVTKTQADADAYARKVAAQLKLIATNPNVSPCKDVITAEMWSGAPATPTATANAAPGQGSNAQAASVVPSSGSNNALAQALTEVAGDELMKANARLGARTANGTVIPKGMSAERVEQMEKVAQGVRGWFESRKQKAEQAKAASPSKQLTDAEKAAMVPQWLRDWEPAKKIRRERLASGLLDVAGFDEPLRPSPSAVVIPSLNARAAVYFVGMLPADPGMWDSMTGLTRPTEWPMPRGEKPYKMPNPEKMIAASVAFEPVFPIMWTTTGVNYAIKFEMPKGTQASAEVSCAFYGPEGETLSTVTGPVRLLHRNDSAVLYHARLLPKDIRGPGVYGVECSHGGRPFVNSTFDYF